MPGIPEDCDIKPGSRKPKNTQMLVQRRKEGFDLGAIEYGNDEL